MEESEFKSLSILHGAFCIGVMVLIIINHFLIMPMAFDKLSNPVDMMSMIIIALGTFAAFMSFNIFNKRMNSIDNKKADSIIQVRAAYIVRWAFLEGASLICILLYFFYSGHQLLLLMGLVLFILLIFATPKRATFGL